MMGELVTWIWRWLYRLVCDTCGGFIWAWQPRHRNRHTACSHAQQDRLYTRAVKDHGYAIEPWKCPDCDAPAVLR